MTKLESFHVEVMTFDENMANSSLRVDSVIRGYHVYKDDWNPEDRFEVDIEETNINDRFACAVIVNSQI